MVFKTRLVDSMSEANPAFPRETISKATDIIQREITDTLAEGGRVEIRGFGSFFLAYRRARRVRNPKTGDTFAVGEKWIPRFKPGKKFRKAVDDARQGGSS